MSRNSQNRPERYNPSFSISTTDVQRYKILLNWFKQYHRRYSCKMNWPSSVINILDNVSDLSFVSAYLLAWTCCRSAELKQIKLSDIINRRNFEIQSSKSKHIRKIYPLSRFKIETLQRLNPQTVFSVVTYDQLRNSIKKARDIAGISLPDGALNCTHIFRHLIATHLSKQGVSTEDISYKLGHASPKTTLQYIHK